MSFDRLTLATLAVLFATLPGLAHAQEMCGGLGEGGRWIGGNPATSDVATAADALEQTAIVLGGTDYVALFTVSAATDVRIEAQGRGSDDPQLDVFDETGDLMISDDDSGGNGAARAETPLEAGDYCVAVRSYDGSPITPVVRIGRLDQPALTAGTGAVAEPVIVEAPAGGNGCGDARPMDGALADGGLSATASVDAGSVWQLVLEAPTALTIRAENEDADPLITLLDGNEDILAENDDFDGLNAQIDLIDPLPAGTYCIDVSAVSDPSLPITTTVTEYDPAAAYRSQVENGSVAPPMDGSVVVTDLGTLAGRTLEEVEVSNIVSWFRFEMPAGLLLAEAVALGDGTDPWLVLYDDLGRQISLNDDYGEGLDSLIAARVAAGRYVIGIKRLETQATGRARMVLEHYVAAQ